MLGYYYMDWTYILVIVAAIMGMIAQSSVKSTFAKYSRVRSSRALTGAQLASYLLKEGAGDVRVDKARGSLTDHYDPKNGVVNLSESVYDSVSVAALSVAAHECGHVMQDREDYTPMKIRSKLVPIANFGSQASIPLFFIGLIFNFGTLITIGICFFFFAVLFQLVTLPVELNASHRALFMLEQGGYLSSEEVPMAKKVLRAAAMTYVAAALGALLQLLRLILISRRRND